MLGRSCQSQFGSCTLFWLPPHIHHILQVGVTQGKAALGPNPNI